MLINSCGDILFSNNEDFEIKKFESPDFILKSPKKSIGVEITRAISQNEKKALEINKKYFQNKHIIYSNVFDKNIKMNKNEIISILNQSMDENRKTNGYLANDLEETISSMIIEAIQKKESKFPKFTKYDENILLIHSEMYSSLKIEFVISIINRYLEDNNLGFDSLFLKLSDNFFYFNKKKYLKSFKIN